jgi:hypothetical protein
MTTLLYVSKIFSYFLYIKAVFLQYQRIINFEGIEEVPARLLSARDVAHEEVLMDDSSVTRSSPPSTKAIVADETFCAQAAALLLCDEEPIRKAFIGEPAEEVLEMVRWALKHDDDEGFDAAKALTSWAKNRRRGAWSSRPRPSKSKEQNTNAELAGRLADFWVRHPEDLAALLNRVEASLNGRS